MPAPFLKSLGPIVPAQFVERPNRSIVVCDIEGAGRLRAFMPNPGRLWELLLPGVRLWLADGGADAERKTRYTVLAVERNGDPVFLHTHINNEVARALIEHNRVPGLEDARVVRSEVAVDRSLFDFLLKRKRTDIYLEVKSCTLFGNGVAMFPDAVTSRGKRHLEELAAMRRHGLRTAVLFVVHSPRVDYFMPDYHTDLAFSRTLLDVRHRVDVMPMGVSWTDQLNLRNEVRRLAIPWRHVQNEARDRGNYLLILQRNNNYLIVVGGMTDGLDGFLARCRKPPARSRESLHQFCRTAKNVTTLPIRSSIREDERIAAALGDHFPPAPEESLPSGLDMPVFESDRHPFHSTAFHDVLARFRMRRPVS